MTSISSATLRRWSALSPDEIACATQCRAHGADLRDDVDAVAVLFDHAREAAHLAFDAAQPFEVGALAVLLHAVYIPP